MDKNKEYQDRKTIKETIKRGQRVCPEDPVVRGLQRQYMSPKPGRDTYTLSIIARLARDRISQKRIPAAN